MEQNLDVCGDVCVSGLSERRGLIVSCYEGDFTVWQSEEVKTTLVSCGAAQWSQAVVSGAAGGVQWAVQGWDSAQTLLPGTAVLFLT